MYYTNKPITKLEKLAQIKERLNSKDNFSNCADEDIKFLLDMIAQAQETLARLGLKYEDEIYLKEENK